MPNAQETITAIEANLTRMHSYPDWSIGRASDPEHRKADLEYPAFFRYWETDSPEVAAEVRDYFAAKGMQAVSDSGRTPSYVFLY